MKHYRMGLTAVLVTLGLAGASFGTAGCGPNGTAGMNGWIPPGSSVECGGLADSSDKNAPKTIKSNTLTKFSLDFKEEGLHSITEGDKEHFPVGRYSLSAERQDGRAHFRLSCHRRETDTPQVFEADLDASALDELHALLMEHNVPAVNGSSLRNSALGTFLSFHALYDSGETLSVYAEGGVSTIPHGWCGTDIFVEFFLEKLGAKGKLVDPPALR